MTKLTDFETYIISQLIGNDAQSLLFPHPEGFNVEITKKDVLKLIRRKLKLTKKHLTDK